jgi:predicted amino acid racemase
MYPSLEINLEKVKHNTKVITSRCKESGLDVYGVTKVFCAIPEVAQVMVDAGVTGLADSRIANIKKMAAIDAYKVLLRLTSPSEAAEVVKHVDLSFNSEIKTIRLLNEEANKLGVTHDIMLMIDLGDLREGIFYTSDYMSVIKEVIEMTNVNLKGLGTNLTCYGGIIPYPDTLQPLIDIKKKVKKELNFEIEILSAGNSSSIHLVDKNEVANEFNNLRLGESLTLGYETAFGERIEDTYDDAFTLKAEIIELQEKPSYPIGKIGRDAFGNVPVIEDKGLMKRAILAVGKQDVNPDNLEAIDSDISVVGSSSDHLIIDLTSTKSEYQVGDIIEFKLSYGSLLNLATSEYVYKSIK